jgi:flagellar protein FlgJ
MTEADRAAIAIGQPVHLDMEGAELTRFAFDTTLMGFGAWVVTIAVCLFGFSTMISWSYYGEKGTEYLFGPQAILPYKFVFVIFVFLGMVLDGMRRATLDGGSSDSGEMQLFEQMFDRQIAQGIAGGRGLGRARLLAEQLRRMPGAAGEGAAPADAGPPAESASAGSPAGFVRDVMPHAIRAAGALGVSPLVLVAQAALESGWGERLPRRADGSTSFNVFGIKAGRAWAGERAAARTVEYEQGRPVAQDAEFRAYPDLAAAFDDYARLIATDPRYAGARAGSGDAARYYANCSPRATRPTLRTPRRPHGSSTG